MTTTEGGSASCGMSGESGHSDWDDGEKLALKDARVMVYPSGESGSWLANEKYE